MLRGNNGHHLDRCRVTGRNRFSPAARKSDFVVSLTGECVRFVFGFFGFESFVSLRSDRNGFQSVIVATIRTERSDQSGRR